MYILIKNYNGRLIFVMNDKVDFDLILDELKGLLEQSFFKKKDYYPKAFFDFQCRKMNDEEILKFFETLIEYECIFGGLIEDRVEQKVELKKLDRSIHGGEVITINEDTLITGKINPGAIVYLNAKLYVMQEICGVIECCSEDGCITGQWFKDATLRFFNHHKHHFTSFSMTQVYYKNDVIVIEKGDYIYV